MRLNYWWNGASASSKLKKINFIFFIGCGSQRNQQSNSLHSLSLVGYGLAGQPRAPPKEENGMKESCEVEWSWRKEINLMEPGLARRLSGLGGRNEENEAEAWSWMNGMKPGAAIQEMKRQLGSKQFSKRIVGCSGWRSLIDCGAGAASINQLTSPPPYGWSTKSNNKWNSMALNWISCCLIGDCAMFT